uniref:COP9 signalosome complex subunit 9 n=1 Tax=Peromyscus maniculatus bairdii TaxID=230844 RepID=A0A8C8UL45_PERMB
MFPKSTGPYTDLDKDGGSTRALMDLAANEKAVLHTSYFNVRPACCHTCKFQTLEKLRQEDHTFKDNSFQK